MKEWTSEQSAQLYNINGWGGKYFSINEKGNVTVNLGEENVKADIHEIISEIESNNIASPFLLRFPDLLEDRIKELSNAFKNAAKNFNYKSESYTVYPVKVNQMKPVVEEIAKLGSNYNIGLEAGSKPELHTVLALARNDAPIICNGYKDEDFVELALLAKKMGKDIYLVVEKPNELELITKVSRKYDIKPNIGIRIKLTTSGSGKWEDSGGDKSKFGLRTSELLDAIEFAKKENLLEDIKLVHFHLGSQITRIRNIKNALREAAQYYYELRKLGCGIEYFDVGGGLGVDYDGTNSSNASSINYDLQEYANDVVFAIVNISDKYDLPHPKIITESGRAITAYHSVLIFDVLESMSVPQISRGFKLPKGSHENLIELLNIYKSMNKKNMYESFHDANQIREENNTLFSLGHMGLYDRANADKLYWSVALKFYDLCVKSNEFFEEFHQASRLLSDKYFCNFSLFQSLPDSWAIDQVFPVIPIQRHNEKPKKRATLQDISCDSDGKLDQFVGKKGIDIHLPVHELIQNEKYYIGVFLVGAYQEILGDLHNLFGDTNAVHIKSNGKEWEIEKSIDGESVDEVLSYVGFNAKELVKQMESWITKAVKSGQIDQDQGREYLAIYRSGLYGYTYLE